MKKSYIEQIGKHLPEYISCSKCGYSLFIGEFVNESIESIFKTSNEREIALSKFEDFIETVKKSFKKNHICKKGYQKIVV